MHIVHLDFQFVMDMLVNAAQRTGEPARRELTVRFQTESSTVSSFLFNMNLQFLAKKIHADHLTLPYELIDPVKSTVTWSAGVIWLYSSKDRSLICVLRCPPPASFCPAEPEPWPRFVSDCDPIATGSSARIVGRWWASMHMIKSLKKGAVVNSLSQLQTRPPHVLLYLTGLQIGDPNDHQKFHKNGQR